MKSRELNKLYQIMRVSRFYFKYKTETAKVAVAKKIIKNFDDKIDEVLVNALKQKEEISYAAKQNNALRERITTEVVKLGMMASLYFSEKSDFHSLGNSDLSYTFYKGLTQVNFVTRCGITLDFLRKHLSELKPYGIREKEIASVSELLKEYDKIKVLPKSLHKDKKYCTENILKGLEELSKMQRTKLDKIAACYFEQETVKREYKKARKYVRYKNPQGMFEAMMRWYRGKKKKGSTRIKPQSTRI